MSRNQQSQSKNESGSNRRPAFNVCVSIPEGRDADGEPKRDSEGREKTKLFRCGALWPSRSSKQPGFSGTIVDTLRGAVHRLVLLPCERDGDGAPQFEVFTANGDGERDGLTRIGAVWPFQTDKEGFSGQIEVPLLGLSTRIALLPPKDGED